MSKIRGVPIHKGMKDYYDQRARKYEEIYTRGGGPASIPDPAAYTKDVQVISARLPSLLGPVHLDIACGTGFWLPYYHSSCSHITLLDQSENMLEECRKKVERLSIPGKAELICADVFGYERLQERFYDTVLLGYFLSHLTRDEEVRLFSIVRHCLCDRGRIIVLDSAWNAERAKSRRKSGLQKRVLTDGREFTIRKCYYTPSDIVELGKRHRVDFHVLYEGLTSILASGQLR